MFKKALIGNYFLLVIMLSLFLLKEEINCQNFWNYQGRIGYGGSSNTIGQIQEKEFLVGHSVGIMRTSDDGKNWDRIFRSPSEVWVLCRDINSGVLYSAYHFYYGYHSGVYKSIDNGFNWFLTGLQNDTRKIFDIKVKKNGYVFVGCRDLAYPYGDGGMFLSTNSGSSWLQILSGLHDVKAVAIDSFGCVYAGTQDLSPYGWALLLRSCDDGNNWHSLLHTNQGSFINEIAVFDSIIIVASNRAIFISTDYGNNWLLSTYLYDEINDVQAYGKYVFFIGREFRVSKDKGQNWLTLNSGLFLGSDFTKILINEKKFLYVLAKNGNLFKSRYSIEEPKAPLLKFPENNSNIGLSNVNFHWKCPTISHAYIFQLSTDSNFNNLLIDTSEIFDTLFNLTSGILQNGLKYYWRVKAYNLIDTSEWSQIFNFTITQTGVEDFYEISPLDIIGIYPNPSNSIFNVSFSLKEKTRVTINIYDLMGRLIMNLFNDELEPGINSLKFSLDRLSSGIYFINAKTSNFSKTEKLFFLK